MKRFPFLIILAILSITIILPSCSQKKPAQARQQAEAIRELGEAYMTEGNYTMALRELLKAEQLYPDDPYLQNNLGLTYMARGRLETAVTHFEKALALSPNYSPARNNLGSVYIALEKWDKAIECFEIVKDDLLYATPYFPVSNLGYVYYRKGNYEKAKRYYREALDMERRFARPHHGLGMIAMATGNIDEAIRRFEMALELSPEAASIYMDLARAYEQKHDYGKALNTYEKVASIAKDRKIGDEAEEAIRKLRSNW